MNYSIKSSIMIVLGIIIFISTPIYSQLTGSTATHNYERNKKSESRQSSKLEQRWNNMSQREQEDIMLKVLDQAPGPYSIFSPAMKAGRWARDKRREQGLDPMTGVIINPDRYDTEEDEDEQKEDKKHWWEN